MYKFLLIDLDDTILDFHKAEKIALAKTLEDFGIDPTPETCALYSRINLEHWERLERKELTREQVLVGRFDVLFEALGKTADAELCARTYEERLSQGHWFLPGALEALESLEKKYQLYLASNGTARVQNGRLDSANIRHFFREIFISQQMGANKPDPVYFARCFEKIPGFDPKKTMIIGDSLTSDIQGGISAGIATCWINPQHKPTKNGITPDYELESLSQLEALLETL